MDEDTIADLKQFIAATVAQATANMATKNDIASLNSRIDDVDLKLDTISITLSGQLNNHEQRLTKLEQRTA